MGHGGIREIRRGLGYLILVETQAKNSDMSGVLVHKTFFY